MSLSSPLFSLTIPVARECSPFTFSVSGSTRHRPDQGKKFFICVPSDAAGATSLPPLIPPKKLFLQDSLPIFPFTATVARS